MCCPELARRRAELPNGAMWEEIGDFPTPIHSSAYVIHSEHWVPQPNFESPPNKPPWQCRPPNVPCLNVTPEPLPEPQAQARKSR